MAQPLDLIANQYEVVAKIHEGGMGEIYTVRHRLLDEVRVVKVLRPQYVEDAQLSARFAQEARAAIQLRHPNIVQIFDFTLDETGAGLIVMEHIAGADLKQLLAAGLRPSLPLALEIGRQSLRALAFLHRHGFIHRDVSPDNLMLTEDVDGGPLVKLIDLGIAKRLEGGAQLTTSGMFLGKYRYASPEHFGARGAEGVETRSDLYSFGLVFYELLTGTYPMPAKSTAELVAAHLYKPPRDFAESDPERRIPGPLRQLLLAALAKDPDERPASADDFLAAVEELQSRHPLATECHEEARRLAARVGPSAERPASSSGAGDESFAAPTTPLPRSGGPPRGAAADAETADAETADAETADDAATGERLLAAAREAMAEGELTTARQLLEKALPLCAGEKGLGERATELGEGLAELERREREVPAAVREVGELIARGALMEADRVLFQAVEAYGEVAELAAIRRRLDELHHRDLAVEVRSLLERAEAHAAAGELDQALEVVKKARVVAPADAAIERTIEESTRRVRTVFADRTRRREETKSRVEELVREAGIAVEAERFAAAVAHLRQALELGGDDRWIRDQLAAAEERQGELEERERRRREARSFLRQAQEAESARDVLKARLLVGQSLDLDPDNAEARTLAAELDRRPLEPVLPAPAREAADRIDELVAAAETLRAWRAVQAAIDEFGDIEPFTALRREIAAKVVDDEGGGEA